MRSSSPPVAPENDTVFITVHWDVGTDIELELDFGDGSPLYSWNWQVRIIIIIVSQVHVVFVVAERSIKSKSYEKIACSDRSSF